MVHISFILIFIAHATISDASRDLEKRKLNSSGGTESESGKSAEKDGDQQDILKQVFKQTLPSLALRQIADLCILVSDKIFKIPSDWLKFLMPLILWLSLHIEDGLVEAMFQLTPTFRQEMTRIH